jgi:hypothetical protein
MFRLKLWGALMAIVALAVVLGADGAVAAGPSSLRPVSGASTRIRWGRCDPPGRGCSVRGC